MEKVIIALFFVLCIRPVFSQGTPKDSGDLFMGRSRHTMYAELGGNSLYYSLNYEGIGWQAKRLHVAGRIGLMVLPMTRGGWEYGVPIELSVFWGKRKHFIEAGLGITYMYANEYRLAMDAQGNVDLAPYEMVHRFYRVLRIGYRYHREDGGFFLKAGFTPLRLIEQYRKGDFGGVNEADLMYYAESWAGLGVGWTFRK